MPTFTARVIPRFARHPKRPKPAPPVTLSRFRSGGRVFLAMIEADSKADARSRLRQAYPPPEFALGRVTAAQATATADPP